MLANKNIRILVDKLVAEKTAYLDRGNCPHIKEEERNCEYTTCDECKKLWRENMRNELLEKYMI